MCTQQGTTERRSRDERGCFVRARICISHLTRREPGGWGMANYTVQRDIVAGDCVPHQVCNLSSRHSRQTLTVTDLADQDIRCMVEAFIAEA
jgi:hypothetical protein